MRHRIEEALKIARRHGASEAALQHLPHGRGWQFSEIAYNNMGKNRLFRALLKMDEPQLAYGALKALPWEPKKRLALISLALQWGATIADDLYCQLKQDLTKDEREILVARILDGRSTAEAVFSCSGCRESLTPEERRRVLEVASPNPT